MKGKVRSSCFLILLSVTWWISGCSESALVGSASVKKPQKTQSNDSKEKFPVENGGSELPGTEPIDSGAGSLELRRSECWFAVSGAWIDDSTVFPATYEHGDKIVPGGTFDAAGGVYLPGSKDPYVYGKDTVHGGITKAVDNTFDTIMVAKGMTVTIHDSSGNLILEKIGPFIAVTNGHKFIPTARMSTNLKNNGKIKGWLKEYINSEAEPVKLVPGLWSARSVLVSTNKGSHCENTEL